LLLLVGPAAPPLGAGDHLNSRHRTASNTGASTVACADAWLPTRDSTPAQGGPHRRETTQTRKFSSHLLRMPAAGRPRRRWARSSAI